MLVNVVDSVKRDVSSSRKSQQDERGWREGVCLVGLEKIEALGVQDWPVAVVNKGMKFELK